ncbi:MAG: DinB family protein [Streptosporangiaceae bacterium]|jgi:uncharacterized damage-inducible protein DinB
MSTAERTLTGEYADLLQTLGKHRDFLRYTVRDLTHEQAARRTTASDLCLAGIIKHVALVERNWLSFIEGGASAMASGQGDVSVGDWLDGFRPMPGETLAGLLRQYDEVARRTDELVASRPDLDAAQPLPEAPWFEPGASWTVRRVLLHILAETAQHAGHADIIRESLDGGKTMG